MRRFWGPFIVALVVLVAGFFIVSLSMASYHDRSLKEEWNSWIAEETVKTEDNPLDVEVTLPGEIVPEETT